MNKDLLFGRYAANLQDTLSNCSLKISSNGHVDGQEYYLCPIALTLHTRDHIKTGQLTIDHVPPQGLGGKPLILTNKEINNTDGQSSDKKLLNYFAGCNFQSHGLPLGTKVSSKDIELQSINSQFSLIKENDGHKDKIIVSFDPGSINMKILDERGFFEKWDGLQFTVKGSFTKKLDKKAILKCSYLTAFSRIGYELLFYKNGFQEKTYHLLANILNSKADINTFPLVIRNEHAPIKHSNVGMITHPLEYRSIFVNLVFTLDTIIYKYVVFLPHPDDNTLDKLHNLKNIPKVKNVNFTISEIDHKIYP